MSAEQELPRVGSVWRKGDEWRRVNHIVGGDDVPTDWVAWRTFERPDRYSSVEEWRAWAAGAECVSEGEGE